MTEEMNVEETEATVAETPMAFDPRSLPDDLANEPSLRNFDDVSKLAKSYVHLVKMRGVPEDQLIKLPSDGNYSEVYNKLGRPEDPSGYEIDISNDLNKDYAENAHQLGLSKTKQEKSIHG